MRALNRAVSAITITAISVILLAWTPSTVYGAPTPVVDCTGDSTADGQRLILTVDIDDFTGDCIVINHNNVTFDCKGFTIDGDGVGNTEGIRIEGDNVTIKNCNITDFKFGIDLNGNGATITRNTLSSNQSGLDVSGDNNKITLNSSTGNTSNGLEMRSGSTGNKLDRNDFNDNVSHGIVMSNSDGNSFNANNANDNFSGIRLLNDSDNNTFKRNITNDNGRGFDICGDCGSNTFTANTADLNSILGFLDTTAGTGTAGTDNTYTRNECSDNGTLQDHGSEPDGLCSPQD